MSVAGFEARARLGPESNGILMTAEEFDAVADRSIEESRLAADTVLS